jgi:hypothetical protein
MKETNSKNVVAYYGTELITALKRFTMQSPGASLIYQTQWTEGGDAWRPCKHVLYIFILFTFVFQVSPVFLSAT